MLKAYGLVSVVKITAIMTVINGRYDHYVTTVMTMNRVWAMSSLDFYKVNSLIFYLEAKRNFIHIRTTFAKIIFLENGFLRLRKLKICTMLLKQGF